MTEAKSADGLGMKANLHSRTFTSATCKLFSIAKPQFYSVRWGQYDFICSALKKEILNIRSLSSLHTTSQNLEKEDQSVCSEIV